MNEHTEVREALNGRIADAITEYDPSLKEGDEDFSALIDEVLTEEQVEVDNDKSIEEQLKEQLQVPLVQKVYEKIIQNKLEKDI